MNASLERHSYDVDPRPSPVPTPESTWAKREVFKRLLSRRGEQDLDEAWRIAQSEDLSVAEFNTLLSSALIDDLALGHVAGITRIIEHFSLGIYDLRGLSSAALQGIQTNLLVGRFEAAQNIQELFGIAPHEVESLALRALEEQALTGLEAPLDQRTLRYIELILAHVPFTNQEAPAQQILKTMLPLLEAGKLEAVHQLTEVFGFTHAELKSTIITALLGQLRQGAIENISRIESEFGVIIKNVKPATLVTAAEEGYLVCMREGRLQDAELLAETFDIQFAD